MLLGGGVDAEGTIRGIAVNIAARMEQSAPAGALRISQDTYAQGRGLFDVQAQQPLSVKGVDAPVQRVLVQRARPRSFRIATRGIEGLATRMIGRDTEPATLRAAFAHLFAEPSLAMVTVVAEAGVGKSRLLREFEARGLSQPDKASQTFRGRATQHIQVNPSACCTTSSRGGCRSRATIRSTRREAKVERHIAPLFLSDGAERAAVGPAHLLGHLAGIDFSDSPHLRGILDWPKTLHWADDGGSISCAIWPRRTATCRSSCSRWRAPACTSAAWPALARR